MLEGENCPLHQFCSSHLFQSLSTALSLVKTAWGRNMRCFYLKATGGRQEVLFLPQGWVMVFWYCQHGKGFDSYISNSIRAVTPAVTIAQQS